MRITTNKVNLSIGNPLYIFCVLATLIFVGCASNDHELFPVYQKMGVKRPSPLNDFTGGIFVEPFANDYIEIMKKRCIDYGGLNYSSQSVIHETALGEKVIQYKCNASNLKQFNVQNHAPIIDKPQMRTEISAPVYVLTIEEAKQKCLALGFKVELGDFGKCVLQLTK